MVYYVFLEASVLALTCTNSPCVMESSQTSTGGADLFTIDDLSGLIGRLCAGNAQTISRVDMLLQLDHIRETRICGLPSFLPSPVFPIQKSVFDPISPSSLRRFDVQHNLGEKDGSPETAHIWTGGPSEQQSGHPTVHKPEISGFSISSPDFSFKQPSEVILPSNLFKFEAPAGTIADGIMFEIGNAGQSKKHGRPRRGVTPHKSSPEVVQDSMPDFSTFFLNSKL